MNLKLTAKLDKRGSEAAFYNHYVVGKKGEPVCGGLYVKKDHKNPPDIVEIEIEQKKES
jgi:hypothetical protein